MENDSNDINVIGTENSICPYLGLYSDRETHYIFPNIAHVCFRVTNQSPIGLAHQNNVCFTQQYRNCQVYKKGPMKELPRRIRARNYRKQSAQRNLVRWVLSILIIVGALFLALTNSWVRQAWNLEQDDWSSLSNRNIYTPFIPSPDGTSIRGGLVALQLSLTLPASATPVPTKITVATKTQTATITLTPVNETSTLVPVTLTQGPALETPFGFQGQYVLHKVSQGESLPVIARKYHTTEEVIKKINRKLQKRSVWAGDILVIHTGEKTSSSAVPLKAIFLEKETTVKSVAQKFAVSMTTILELNSLGSTNVLPAMRWLILPDEED